MTLPIVITKAGLQPQTPAALLSKLLAAVSAINPGYTANLPGGLIEDISSTDVYAIAQCDSAMVDLVNSLTPYGINESLLTQLGSVYGQVLGTATNSSVYCLFTGTPGYVIQVGFTVSDGTYQYVVQDGGIVAASGVVLLYCVASSTGTWAIPAGTVTTLITSVPSPYTLTVTNPNAGIPSTGAQNMESYRAQVLQAGIAPSIGSVSYLKTNLQAVPGVVQRLVSVQPVGGNFRIICGGGDPYSIAYAIFISLFDYNNLTGSEPITISGITKANPGVINTFPIVHGLTTGQSILITGVAGMTQVNNVTAPEYTVVVLTPYTFSLKRSGTPVDTSAYGTYTSGGLVTPDIGSSFTQSISVINYPNTYPIVFVTPPAQNLSIIATWQTSAINFTSDAAVAQLSVPAMIDYVNALPVGYAVNVMELQTIWAESVATILPAQFISQLTFSFSIGGVIATPVSNLLSGDSQGYFQTSSTLISTVRA